jgi:hypothetical protein
MVIRRILRLLLAVSSGIAFAAQAQTTALGACEGRAILTDTTGGSSVYPVDGDAAQVYRTVFDLFFVDGEERPSVIVLHDRAENASSLYQYCQHDCEKWWTHKSKIDTATIIAFRTHTRARPRIVPFSYAIPVSLMSWEDRQRIEVAGCANPREISSVHPAGVSPFWSEFERRYPGAWGTLTLSKIGFNTDSTEALVEASFSCGDSCDSNETLLLRKIQRRWTVVERIPTYSDALEPFRGMRYRGPSGDKPSDSELLVASDGAPNARARLRGGDEARVYRLVLDSLYHLFGKSPRRIVVTDYFAMNMAKLPAHSRQIDPSTLASYKFLSTVRAPFSRRLQLRAPVSILPRDSLPTLSRIGDPLAKRAEVAGDPLELSPLWLGFAQRYPDAWGMVGFTRVAFNPAHTQGMVFTSHTCGDGCGNADTWLLERRGGEWRIAERIPRERHPDWLLDSVRYLGVDANPLAHRTRRVRGRVFVAATGRALPALRMIVVRNIRSDSLMTDSKGRYVVDNIPITGGIQLLFQCPWDPRRGPMQAAAILVHPGIDSIVDVPVDFRRCLLQKRAHPLIVGNIALQAAKSTYPDPDAAAVYRGVLDALYPRDSTSKGPILLQPFTFRACDHCVDAEMPRLIRQGVIDPSTARSFSSLPKDSVWLRPDFEYSREVKILSLAEQKFLLQQADPVGGYDKKDMSLLALAKDAYPGVDSIWALSRVAFNDAGTEALVQVGTRSSYWLEGETMLLRKSTGGWRVARRHIEQEETSGERVGDRCEPADAPTGRPTLGELERFVGDAHISSVGTSPDLRQYSETLHLRITATDTLHRFYWLPTLPGDKRKPIRFEGRQLLGNVQIIDDSTGRARAGIKGTLELTGNNATITLVEYHEGYMTFDGWFEQYRILRVTGREFFGNWFTESGMTIPQKGYFCGSLR